MARNIHFDVKRLLAKTDRHAFFNACAAGENDSLFSWDNTYNSVVVDCICEGEESDGAGLWDASVEIRDGMFVVSGNEGCSGYGLMMEAFFDANKKLIKVVQIGNRGSKDPEATLAKMQTLVLGDVYVEPISTEIEQHILERFEGVAFQFFE